MVTKAMWTSVALHASCCPDWPFWQNELRLRSCAIQLSEEMHSFFLDAFHCISNELAASRFQILFRPVEAASTREAPDMPKMEGDLRLPAATFLGQVMATRSKRGHSPGTQLLVSET